jgi:hypothetical protein
MLAMGLQPFIDEVRRPAGIDNPKLGESSVKGGGGESAGRGLLLKAA